MIPDEDGGKPPMKWWAKLGVLGLITVGAGTVLMVVEHGNPFASAPAHKPKQEEQATLPNAGLPWTPPPRVIPAVARVPAPPVKPPAAPLPMPVVQAPVAQSVWPHMEHREEGIMAFPQQQAAPRGPVQTVSASGAGGRGHGTTADPLGAELQPTKLDGTSVTEMPDPNFLISAGRVIPCTDQTAINTTLAGGVTAILPNPVRGDTGTVTVLDKGTKVVGTIQHGIVNGLDRAFVLWQRFITPPLYDADGIPHEYTIAVNSPATDETGATGLPGDVNRHLASKILGFLGISLIQGGVQAGVQAAGSRSGNTMNFYSVQSGADNAANAWLGRLVNIPDVLTRLQGQSCAVYVMRDLDMKAAYQLRARANEP